MKPMLDFYRERLRKAGVIEVRFDPFEEQCLVQGLYAGGAQIIDAIFTPLYIVLQVSWW